MKNSGFSEQQIAFILKDFDLRAYQHGVLPDFSRPCKSTDNDYVEALNGCVRTECLP